MYRCLNVYNTVQLNSYILNDYVSDYKYRLTKLQNLPLMYILELYAIIFLFAISNILTKALTSIIIILFLLLLETHAPQHIYRLYIHVYLIWPQPTMHKLIIYQQFLLQPATSTLECSTCHQSSFWYKSHQIQLNSIPMEQF